MVKSLFGAARDRYGSLRCRSGQAMQGQTGQRQL